ncbi:MAG: acyltransferase family protein [Cardiobacteriaceae bacterium]|nr:acyltransferase family protein [Cardiobacteriaceae bacterium]
MFLIKNSFTYQKINTGRQLEIDLAKAFALMFMAWVHTLEETESVTEALMPTLIEKVFGGPFAAPVFMVALGIGLVYTKHGTAHHFYQRGITLLVIGFVLNIVRFVSPAVWRSVGLDQPFDYEYEIAWLVSVDILQFAGLAFLYFGWATQHQLSPKALAIIAIICSLLGSALNGITIEHHVGKQFLGYFWAASDETFFPFLNWLIFPTFGYCFGLTYQRCQDKALFYSLAMPIGMILGLGYITLTMHMGWGMYRDATNSHYYMNLIDATFILCLVVGWFGFCYALLELFPQKYFRPLFNLSQNINQVYCIHWIILGFFGVWFRDFLEKTELPVWEVTLYAALILTTSAILAEIYVRYIQKRIFKP